ncbi:MAG TPA: hypothetical protein VK589_07330, partial [Chryseolinea sp.]|nr:hypothetical protein [Chryseolinea sp.]
MSSKLIFLLLFQLVGFYCSAQTNSSPPLYLESGNFHYKNYSIKDYKADFQNWAVLQDKSGIMVFANGNG